jgi:DNA-binding IclR family transcriptional regulator
VPVLTPSHDAVLALLDSLPEGADAERVVEMLGVPEVEASQLLDELEASGCVASAVEPMQ